MDGPDAKMTPILALKPAAVQRSAKGAWVNALYDDVYAQAKVAVAESTFVFLEKNDLPARFQKLWEDAAAGKAPALFCVGELGFGSGLNFLLTWKLWRDIAAQYNHLPPQRRPRLHFASCEKHPLCPQDLAMIQADWDDLRDLCLQLQKAYPPLVRGMHALDAGADVRLQLMFGDAADMLAQFSGPVDAWFLDGFSPAKNPEMWDAALLHQVGRLTAAGGTFATFSAARAVLEGLAAAGFTVEKVKGFGVKRKMGTGMKGHGTPAPRRMPDVSVIGAGIAGASVARALALRGCRVTVYERHPAPAQEASGNPRGIIYPKLTVDEAPMGRFNRQAFCHVLPLLAQLDTINWSPCGVLRLDMDAAEAHRSQKLAGLHAYPAGFTRWQAETPYGRSALFHAGGGMMDAAAFVRALLDHPLIDCRYGATAAPDAGVIVDCTANAAAEYGLPLRPLRGQVVALNPTPASAAITHVICHEGYITPVTNGLHHAGATFQKEAPQQPDDHRSDPRAEDNGEILEKLHRSLPQLGLQQNSVQSARAAYRATTPDKLPMIGPLPIAIDNGQVACHENIYVAAGFGAHGLTTAPLAGDMIAAMICGEPLPVPLDLLAHLLPARFLKRAAKAGSPSHHPH